MSRIGALLAASRFVATASNVPTTALSFDGTSAYVETPAATVFDINSDYTVIGYVNPTDAGHKAVIWSAGSGAANYDALLVRTGQTNLEWQTLVADTEVLSKSCAFAGFGVWQQVAIRRSGNTIAPFVDGALAVTAWVGDITGRAAASRLALGAQSLGAVPDSFYAGATLGLKVWSAALSDAEIAAEVGHLLPVRTADVWGSYILSGPTDLAEVDAAQSAFVGAGTLSTVASLPAGIAL